MKQLNSLCALFLCSSVFACGSSGDAIPTVGASGVGVSGAGSGGETATTGAASGNTDTDANNGATGGAGGNAETGSGAGSTGNAATGGNASTGSAATGAPVDNGDAGTSGTMPPKGDASVGAGSDATVGAPKDASVTDQSAPGVADQSAFDGGGPTPWPAANQVLSEIIVPTFPSVNFTVTDYGAKADGQTDNTAAFKSALAACSAAGGGHVVVPAGTFVVGAITLVSHCDLHLDSPQTTLQFTSDVSKYPVVLTRFRGQLLMNHSPMIYAYGQTDIGLTGSGVLDGSKTATFQVDTGQGENLIGTWNTNQTPIAQRVMPAGSNLRVTYVEPYNCTNVLIQGVTINNGQFWNIHPTQSKNVTVDGVTIYATAQETDGCDPESSDHVVIENVKFRTGDDDVAIKSGRDNDGRAVNVPSTNIVVQHVNFDGNYGILALGSEESGGIHHVWGYDMTAVDNHTRGVGRVFQYCLFTKANWDRGGVVDDIHLDTVKMYNISASVVYGDMTYNDITTGPFPPTFGDVHLSNIIINGAQQVFDVFATPSHPYGAITLDNCTFTNVSDTTNTLTDVVPAPVLTNVTVNGKAAR